MTIRRRGAWHKDAGVDSSIFWDFQPGQRVMTVDKIPGTVKAVQDGAFPGQETYDVVLDNGLGGGSYGAGDLSDLGQTTAARATAAEVLATGVHLAVEDYPELGSILDDRPDPGKLSFTASTGPWYHGTRHTLAEGDIMEGGKFPSNQGAAQPGQHVYYTGRPDVAHEFAEAGYGPEHDLDAEPKVYQVEPVHGHEPDPDEDGGFQSFRAPSVRVIRRHAASDGAQPGPISDQPATGLPEDDDQPSACSYCGGTDFGDHTDNGRVRQATCSTCGGTMSAHPGAQWTPELIGDPSNHPSTTVDPASGASTTGTQTGINDFIDFSSRGTTLASKTAAGVLSWDEIGNRHPHVYGDSEIHGEDADGADGPGIGDAANYLAHERPGHQDAEDSSVHDLDFHEQVVHPRHIDYSPSGADNSRVQNAREGYRQHPHEMPPLVLVHRHGVYQVADGHHRAEAAAGLNQPVRAYVAHSPYPDTPFADGEKGPFHGAKQIPKAREPKPKKQDENQLSLFGQKAAGLRLDTGIDPDQHENEQTHPGWSHQSLYAYPSESTAKYPAPAGFLSYSKTPEGHPHPTVAIHMLKTYPDHRGQGVASTLMDELRNQHPEHMFDHGAKSPSGKAFWDKYKDPGDPKLNLDHPDNADKKDLHRPTEEARWRGDKDLSFMGAIAGQDWCTWRREARCTFPGDSTAVSLAIPQDRGPCPWETPWQQQVCPISEPGPMALMQAKGVKQPTIQLPLRVASGATTAPEAKMAAKEDGPTYLRFGHWPEDERSHNNVTGEREEGVSVYELDHHGKPKDPDPDYSRGHEHDEHCDEDCSMDMDNDDYGNDTREEMDGRVHRAERNRYNGNDRPSETGHLVKGEMTGIGHDGEPLLQNVRRVGDWIDHKHLFIPGAPKHRLARESYDEDYESPKGLPKKSAALNGAFTRLASQMREKLGPGSAHVASAPQQQAMMHEAAHLDLYHRTTPEAAAAIYQDKRMHAKESTGETYWSNRRGDETDSQTAGYGSGLVHIRVPEHLAEMDDEFPDGEEHYRVHKDSLAPHHFVED